MASLLLTVAGSAIGNALLPGIGGALLGGVGALAGATIDNALFGSPTLKGPRLENLKVQDSSYGNGIPIPYGRARVAGNVIWASDIQETITEEEVGGKGGVSPTNVQRASYAIDCAIAIGFGPIGRIATIWADGKIIYRNGAWKSGVINTSEFYLGTTTQTASPTLEGALGAGNVPAYRGLAYVVLHGLQLGFFGNRLPNLSFEVEALETALAPSFLGEVNPDLITRTDTAAHPLGAPPIVLKRSGSRVLEVLVCALTQSSTTYTFAAKRYDVSGTVPLELSSSLSASFNVGATTNDFSCALSPDGRSVAFHVQMSNAGNTVHTAIYTIETGSFGSVTAENFVALGQQKQLGWLDAQHFVLCDTVSGKRGVRVYAASGTTPVPYGFYDVWGTGSSTTRFQMKYAQYVPLSGGLLHVMADHASTPNNAYAKSLIWRNGTLVAGAQITVSSALGAFGAQNTTLLPLPDGDILFARWNTTTLKVMSFLAGFEIVSTTRNWASFTLPGIGNSAPCVGDGKIVFLQFPSPGSGYTYGEIGFTPTGFGALASAFVSGSYSGTIDNFIPQFIGPSRILLQAAGSSASLSRLALIQRSSASTTLQSITENLLLRAGYSSADFDLSALASAAVDGFVVDGPMAARAALEPLQRFEPFSLVESDGVLKASLSTATPMLTVANAEARAGDDEEMPPLLEVTRGQVQDSPREVVVDYIDAALDFQRGSQRARRLASPAQTQEKINLPVICSGADAKRVAERQLYLSHAAQRELHSSLSRAYSLLDVGDVVNLGGETLRITEVTQNGLMLKLRGLPVISETLTSAAQAESGEVARNFTLVPIPSSLFLLDLPMLRREDNQPGFYVAASGADGWQGCGLWKAADGINFTKVDTLFLPATCGVAASILGTAARDYKDNKNTLTVALLYGSLSSCTELELLNGANAALVGNEIIQFQTATLNADGSYTLSNLLRGRRGSEAAMSAHSVGERFVLLSSTTLHFLPLEASARGFSSTYRAVSVGEALDNPPSEIFTPQLKTMQPLAPVHITASRDTSSNATFSWKRRARLDGAWQDYVDVPLDETSEKYEVDIMNGVSVVRTLTGLTGPTANYTATQQAADFGSAQPSLSIKIYQLSALYGRGVAGEATV